MLIKNFKMIMKIYRNMSSDDHPVMLGRWYIDYTKNVRRKIDLANEDHCGVCNQYEKNINTQLLVPKQIPTQLLIPKQIPSQLLIPKQVPSELIILKN